MHYFMSVQSSSSTTSRSNGTNDMPIQKERQCEDTPALTQVCKADCLESNVQHH
jgi:hypothetical protein